MPDHSNYLKIFYRVEGTASFSRNNPTSNNPEFMLHDSSIDRPPSSSSQYKGINNASLSFPGNPKICTSHT